MAGISQIAMCDVRLDSHTLPWCLAANIEFVRYLVDTDVCRRIIRTDSKWAAAPLRPQVGKDALYGLKIRFTYTGWDNPIVVGLVVRLRSWKSFVDGYIFDNFA